MLHVFARRSIAAVSLAAIVAAALVAPAAAHESRQVGGYVFVVGFIGEPVYTGQKSGLEFSVADAAGAPVTGLADTLDAEVIYQGERRALPLSPRFGQDGWYQSVFFPTSAGPYTFRIYGSIEDQQIDQSFTSSEEGFDEVNEATTGQFPIVLPGDREIAANAERGAAAADQVTIAMLMGGAALVLSLIALALALAGRRRPA